MRRAERRLDAPSRVRGRMRHALLVGVLLAVMLLPWLAYPSEAGRVLRRLMGAE